MAAEPSSRTLVLSVVAIDLVGFSRESVADQVALKSNFNEVLLRAITNIATADRIVLDTGDGVAIGFLGDPEDALYVAMYMHFNINRDRPAIRIGVNLGPVKLATGAGGHPNIIGDGINVAERIMTFAEPGQLAASRPFFEVMSRMSGQYKSLFQHVGVRTDNQVRDHDVYLINKSGSTFHLAEKGVKERALQRIDKATPAATSAAKLRPPPSVAPVSSMPVESNTALIDFLENGKKVAATATLLAAIALGLAATLIYRKTRPEPTEVNVPVIASVNPEKTDTEGGAVTTTAPPVTPTAGTKSAAANVSPGKTNTKSAPAHSVAPPVASKSAPAPIAAPAASKSTAAVVAPAPVVKPPPLPVAPAPVPTREVPKDSKAEKNDREREEKSPGRQPVRDEIRKAIQARPLDREKSLPAPIAPVVPSLQSPVQAPRPESVAPTPSLPLPVAPRPDTSAVVMERRDPAYPIEGIRQGIFRTVIVKARLSIDARGAVTDVVILQGGPIVAFARQTQLTLRDWKFNPGTPGRSFDVEITFKP
ncbi:MAG: TonB family protein [Betaproteobacteria bacterium]